MLCKCKPNQNNIPGTDESGKGIGWTRFPRGMNGGIMRACLSAEIPTSLIDKKIIIRHHLGTRNVIIKARTTMRLENQLTSWSYVRRGISAATEAASNSDGVVIPGALAESMASAMWWGSRLILLPMSNSFSKSSISSSSSSPSTLGLPDNWLLY